MFISKIGVGFQQTGRTCRPPCRHCWKELSLFDWDNLQPDRPGVNRLRADKAVVGELLEHVLEPSKTIHDKYRSMQLVLDSGKVVAGVVAEETPESFRMLPNLLAPEQVVVVHRADVQEAIPSQVSAMPTGLVNVLTRDEVVALVSFLEAGDDLPTTLKHQPGHGGAGVSPPK